MEKNKPKTSEERHKHILEGDAIIALGIEIQNASQAIKKEVKKRNKHKPFYW